VLSWIQPGDGHAAAGGRPEICGELRARERLWRQFAPPPDTRDTPGLQHRSGSGKLVWFNISERVR